jgi:hypothetical protein
MESIEVVQVHDDRIVSQAAPDKLPLIAIQSLGRYPLTQYGPPTQGSFKADHRRRRNCRPERG